MSPFPASSHFKDKKVDVDTWLAPLAYSTYNGTNFIRHEIVNIAKIIQSSYTRSCISFSNFENTSLWSMPMYCLKIALAVIPKQHASGQPFQVPLSVTMRKYENEIEKEKRDNCH